MEYYLYKDKLKGARVLKENTGCESQIYVKQDEVFKMLDLAYRTEERRKTSERLSEINDKRFLVPNYGLIDQNHIFRGISLEYLKDYSTLLKYIKHNYIPLKERKKICFLIYDIIEDLNKLGFSFMDIHLKNFMINNGQIKAIDLDGCKLNENMSKKDLDLRINIMLTYFCQLCISILFNIDAELRRSNMDKLLKGASDREKKLIRSAYFEDEKRFDVKESIDSFTDEFIELNRMLVR